MLHIIQGLVPLILSKAGIICLLGELSWGLGKAMNLML